MLKRRQPKTRVPQISQHAIQLFNELQTHERGSEPWWTLHELLWKELGGKVWEWPLDRRTGIHFWEALEAAAEAAERRQDETVTAK
jgi:hypothetical protein